MSVCGSGCFEEGGEEEEEMVEERLCVCVFVRLCK